MKRSFLLLAILVSSIAAGAPPRSAAPPAIAYDEVNAWYFQSSHLPSPADFETLYDHVRSNLDQGVFRKHADPVLRWGLERRVALLGDLERVDTPGEAVYRVYNHQLHWLKLVDTAHNTYVRETLDEKSGVRSGMSVAPSSRPSPWPIADVKIGAENTPLPTLKSADGLELRGAKSTIIARVDSVGCKPVQLRVELTTYAQSDVLEPSGWNDLYEFPFVFIDPLADDSGCVVAGFSDVAASAIPTYPGFIVYQVEESLFERPDRQGAPLPFPTWPEVTMRGHIRRLTSADAALFATPDGYRWDPSLAN